MDSAIPDSLSTCCRTESWCCMSVPRQFSSTRKTKTAHVPKITNISWILNDHPPSIPTSGQWRHQHKPTLPQNFMQEFFFLFSMILKSRTPLGYYMTFLHPFQLLANDVIRLLFHRILCKRFSFLFSMILKSRTSLWYYMTILHPF